MKRNLKAVRWESNKSNCGKDGINDGKDDFNELA